MDPVGQVVVDRLSCCPGQNGDAGVCICLSFPSRLSFQGSPSSFHWVFYCPM